MPSSFRTEIDARLVGPDTWELLTEFKYDIGHLGSILNIVVPRGTQTDFLSIPWLATWVISPTGKYAKAGVLHDWLYQTGLVSKLVADAMIYEAMIAIDRPDEDALQARLARGIVFLAVLLGGGRAWRTHRRRAAGIAAPGTRRARRSEPLGTPDTPFGEARGRRPP